MSRLFSFVSWATAFRFFDHQQNKVSCYEPPFLLTNIEDIMPQLCSMNVLWATKTTDPTFRPSCYGPPQSKNENRENFVP